MEPIKKKAEGYKLYIFTFILLSLLTLFAVWLTQIKFATRLMVGLIMMVAAIQAIVVLVYNMHLKIHDKILSIFVGLVFSVIFIVIIVTMLDFLYR